MDQGIYRFKMKKAKVKRYCYIIGTEFIEDNHCQVKDKSVKQKQTNNIEYIKIKL